MADIRISVVKFTCPIATGNFDITGNLGGATPKAALFFNTRQQGATGPAASIRVGIGATDGTRQWATFIQQDDAAATTNSARLDSDNSVIRGGATMIAAFVSFGANKVTVNFSAVDAAGRECICVLFGGADLSAYAVAHGGIAAGPSVETTITGVGFQPDAVLIAGAFAGFSETSTDNARLTWGCAINDGSLTQKCISYFADDNEANEDVEGSFRSSRVALEQQASGTGHNITSFNSDGFVVNNTSNQGSQWAFLALRFGGDAFSLVQFTTPTSTGSASLSTPGFTAKAGIVGLSSHTAADTDRVDHPDPCGLGFSAFTASGEAGAVSIQSTDDSDPTDCNMDCSTHALQTGISGGTPVSIAADFVSVAPDAVTVNYTAVDGSARLGWLLAFGSDAAQGGGGGVVGTGLIQSKLLHRTRLVA